MSCSVDGVGEGMEMVLVSSGTMINGLVVSVCLSVIVGVTQYRPSLSKTEI